MKYINISMLWKGGYIFSFLVILGLTDGLSIRSSISSPVVVKNGTDTPVVLDCDYTYDSFEAAGLTVKWFWYGDHEPVYQWIPGGDPEVRGILKGKVNVSYVASSDRYSVHRAVQILSPTSHLSGTYTCTVGSYYDEKKHTVDLLVYAPATSLSLRFHKSSTMKVNATCSSHGLFPRPTMLIYARSQYGKFEMTDANIRTVKHHNTVNEWDEPVLWQTWGEGIAKKTDHNIGSTRDYISKWTSDGIRNRDRFERSILAGENGRRHRTDGKTHKISLRKRRFDTSESHFHEVGRSKTNNVKSIYHGEEDHGASYSIYADVILMDDSLLEDGQLFECEVALPATPYLERTSLIYHPGIESTKFYAQESTSGQGRPKAFFKRFFLAFSLLSLVLR